MTCIYLIQPAELSGTNRFKVGMSAKYIDRIKSYGADVRVLGVFECKKIREVEKELIEELNKKDNVKVIKGKEYFEGPESVIYNTFAEVANKYKKEQYEEEEVALVLDELLAKVEENVRQEQADPMGEIRENIRKEVEAELREKIRKEVEAEIREKNKKETNDIIYIQNKFIKVRECNLCEYYTNSTNDMNKHKNTQKHIQNILNNNACEFCFKPYSNLGNKNKHTKNCKYKIN